MILGGGVSNERGGFGIINLVWVADHERKTIRSNWLQVLRSSLNLD